MVNSLALTSIHYFRQFPVIGQLVYLIFSELMAFDYMKTLNLFIFRVIKFLNMKDFLYFKGTHALTCYVINDNNNKKYSRALCSSVISVIVTLYVFANFFTKDKHKNRILYLHGIIKFLKACL